MCPGRRYPPLVPVLVGLLLLAAAEVIVFVEVAHLIGVLLAVVLLLVVSACGPWLVRQAGFGTWRRAQERIQAGEAPGREILDGVVLLSAGVLISVPGFITDAVGMVLLLPPARAAARRLAVRRLGRRIGDVRAGPVVDARTRTNRGRLPRPPRPPDTLG